MKPIRCITVCLVVIAMVAPVFSTASASSAQQPPSISEIFSRLDQQLAAVEVGIAQIERSGAITQDFDVESALDSYYREANSAFRMSMQTTIDDARALKSEAGQSAAGRRLAEWEERIIAHQPRVERIVGQVTDINLKVRDGRVMFAPELVRSFEADEKQELREWLTPEALLQYGSLLSSNNQRPAPSRAAISTREIGRPLGLPTPARYRSAPHSMNLRAVAYGAPTVAALEPAVAATCVAVCSNPATAAGCVPCVGLALGTGSFLATQIEVALEECNRKRTRLARAACKAGAILGFIVIIA
jgi:hypothetical protein